MRISKIDIALADCEQAIAQTNAQGTRLESYFVGYLLVFMSACFQMEIHNIISGIVTTATADIRIRNFIDNSVSRHFQSVQIDRLAILLGFFGPDRKRRFQRSIKSTPQNRLASTMYSNIITNRHATAHSSGSQMTFKDLKMAYLQGHVVLDQFSAALS
jgi:hypothetical protein